MKTSLFKILILFLFLAMPQSAFMQEEGNSVREVVSRVSDAIVRVKFTLYMTFGDDERSRETSCNGTLVDPSGIVLVANSAINPNVGRRGMQIQTQPLDFQVIVNGETYEAELISKNAAGDLAFLRIGKLEGAEEGVSSTFKSISFSPRTLQMGDSLMGVGRYGEQENYALTFLPFYVASVIDSPKLYYGMTRTSGNLKGTPAFDYQGNAVGVILAYTITNATGKAQATNRLVVKPVDKMAQVIKDLPAPGESSNEEESEKEQDTDSREDSETLLEDQ